MHVEWLIVWVLASVPLSLLFGACLRLSAERSEPRGSDHSTPHVLSEPLSERVVPAVDAYSAVLSDR